MRDIKLVADKIKQEGGRLYLVGGAVRDGLLGKTTHDEDYCITGINSEKFQEILGIKQPYEDKEEVEKILVHEMTNACKLSIPLVVDAVSSYRWSDGH